MGPVNRGSARPVTPRKSRTDRIRRCPDHLLEVANPPANRPTAAQTSHCNSLGNSLGNRAHLSSKAHLRRRELTPLPEWRFGPPALYAVIGATVSQVRCKISLDFGVIFIGGFMPAGRQSAQHRRRTLGRGQGEVNATGGQRIPSNSRIADREPPISGRVKKAMARSRKRAQRPVWG